MFKKFFKTKLVPYLLPKLVYLYVNIVFFTSKIKYNDLENIPQEHFILVFWHRKLLMMPFLYKKIGKDRDGVNVMISEHRDGEMITTVLKYFGLNAIRGSSNKNGAKVLIEAIRTIKYRDIAITPDGPRGPKYTVANGVLTLAKKSNSKIVPISYSAKNYWELNSWDSLIIPKPFTTIEFDISKPIETELKTSDSIKKIIISNLSKH